MKNRSNTHPPPYRASDEKQIEGESVADNPLQQIP
jgi:hypothetical protein